MPRDDIRRFWEQTLSELSRAAIASSVKRVEPDGLISEGAITTLTHYRVTTSSLEGRRIRAWQSVPVGEPSEGA